MIFALLLVACADVSDDTAIIRLAEIEDDLELDHILFRTSDMITAGPILVDILTGAIIAEFEIDETTWLRTVGESLEEHCTFLSVYGVENNMITSDDQLELTLLVLDNLLNVVEEFVITETDLIIYFLNSDVLLNEDDQWVIYYGNGNRIYAYDVNAHTTSQVATMEDDFAFHQIRISDTNQLVFTGSVADDENKHYGWIDLETGDVELLVDTTISISELFVYESYVVFRNDLVNGEVIILNLQTSESRVIGLDGNESQDAKLIGGGRYIATVHTEWESPFHTRFRIYDIQTLAVLFEHEIAHADLGLDDIDGIRNIEFIPIDENRYGIVIETLLGEFHTRAVVIEGEVENEYY